jgi:hypothetical protein
MGLKLALSPRERKDVFSSELERRTMGAEQQATRLIRCALQGKRTITPKAAKAAKGAKKKWQGLKARLRFAPITARLKPCPCYETSFVLLLSS